MDTFTENHLREWCDREAQSDAGAARLFRKMKQALNKLDPETLADYCKGTWRTTASALLGGDWHLLAR